jgi:hypothetical protein
MALYLLSTYNYLSDVLKTLYSGAGTVTNAVCNYLNGTSNEWYFVEDTGVIPAVAYSIPNQTYRDRILWTYNAYRNTLVQRFDGIQPPTVKCRWLSTQLIIDGRTYTLDDWLRDLYIVVEDFDRFTISVLIDAWSVQHKIWPPDDAELHIIDSDGESHVFTVTDPMSDEWSNLLPRPFEPEEPYVEEEEDEEEGEEAPLIAPVETPVEAPVPVETPSPVEAPVPVETPSPVEAPVPAEAPVPVETPSPVEAPVPVETPAPVEAPAPAEPLVEIVAPVESPIPEDEVEMPLPPSPEQEEASSNED